VLFMVAPIVARSACYIRAMHRTGANHATIFVLCQTMPASFQELSRRQRSRLIAASAVRTSLSVALLLVIYAAFPVEPLASTETVSRLLVALVIVAVVVALQFQAIRSANYPQLRAVEAVIIAITVFIVLFALLYLGLAQANPANFTNRWIASALFTSR
jgi:hypothetical protein